MKRINKFIRNLKNKNNGKQYPPHVQSSFLFKCNKRKRILLYTDSRGINVPGYFFYKHYSIKLLTKYEMDEYLCPEKWTTILDFLHLWKKLQKNDYDFVILHAGIVDTSPRSQTIARENIYIDKKEIFDEVFGEKKIKNYLNSDLNCEYEGDKTINLYSLQMLEEDLIPQLLQIPNLIWISPNKINTAWRGNYWKDRPENIRIVEDYAKIFLSNLHCNINLLDLWSLEDVKKFTFDNIHPNEQGSDTIYSKLIEVLES